MNGEELGIADIPHVKKDCLEEKGWCFYLQERYSRAVLRALQIWSVAFSEFMKNARLVFEGPAGAVLKQRELWALNVEYVLYQLVLLLCDSSNLTICLACWNKNWKLFFFPLEFLPSVLWLNRGLLYMTAVICIGEESAKRRIILYWKNWGTLWKKNIIFSIRLFLSRVYFIRPLYVCLSV